MKKKLEAELISIAHRILKLRNKSEIDQLLAETQKLYEKLSVLKFVEENFADVKPTIGREEAAEIVEKAFDKTESEKTDAAEKPKIKQPEPEKPEVAETSPKPEEAAPSEKNDAEPEVKAPETETSEAEEPKQEESAPQETSQAEVKAEADAKSGTEEKPEADDQPASKEPEAKTETAENKSVNDDNKDKDSHGIAEPDKPQSVPEPEPVAESGITFEQPESKEEATVAKTDEFFKPAFEWAFDPKPEDKAEEKPEEKKTQQSEIAFEDLLGAGYKDPVFVKPDETATEAPAEDNRIEPQQPASEPDKREVISINRREDKVPVFKMNSGSVSLNDRISKGITVGLNDRIAFVKNLFNNSNEEYNRVLSQLLTFDTLEQAQDFIDNMVKPDYNNWEGKDEYAQRFMEVVEKKFS